VTFYLPNFGSVHFQIIVHALVKSIFLVLRRTGFPVLFLTGNTKLMNWSAWWNRTCTYTNTGTCATLIGLPLPSRVLYQTVPCTCMCLCVCSYTVWYICKHKLGILHLHIHVSTLIGTRGSMRVSWQTVLPSTGGWMRTVMRTQTRSNTQTGTHRGSTGSSKTRRRMSGRCSWETSQLV
jgi:hypothetical protein